MICESFRKRSLRLKEDRERRQSANRVKRVNRTMILGPKGKAVACKRTHVEIEPAPSPGVLNRVSLGMVKTSRGISYR